MWNTQIEKQKTVISEEKLFEYDSNSWKSAPFGFQNQEWLKSAFFETGNIKDFLYLFPMYAMICMNQILW